MKVNDMIGRVRPSRKVQGIAACLLPFTADGEIAVEAFKNHLRATRKAGLINAVNMDTGYVNYLTEAQRLEVLQWSLEALGPGVPFIAGAYIEGFDGDLVSSYRQQMDQIVAHGGTPIIFQTARLLGRESHEKLEVYRAVCKGYQAVLGFELNQIFAPNGEIFDDEMMRGLLEIPELKGLKHSSLDRIKELER